MVTFGHDFTTLIVACEVKQYCEQGQFAVALALR